MDGRLLNYTAIAGQVYLDDEDGRPTASVFSVSYFKDGDKQHANRAITFLFNGGPGSTAVWLHLGAFGPKRIPMGNKPAAPAGPPYKLVANTETLLWQSDLVFVDPVGTGYSRALGEAKDQDYWGVDEDAASMADFIRAYLTEHKRWNSPEFLVGESYGTIRVSLLLRELQLKRLNNVAFNGAILISPATDVRTFLSGDSANELPYVTNLPTYAATAYYHKALPEKPDSFENFIRGAQEFAATEYLVALFRGDSLPPKRADEIAQRLHHFTGLGVKYLRRSRLRIDSGRFRKELLRKRGKTIAAHDTRFLGTDPDAAGEAVECDPFLPSTSSNFVAVINSYLLEELNVDMPGDYRVFSMEAREAWKRPKDGMGVFSGFLNTTPYLARATRANNGFRIFLASGFHDLTTTFSGARYIVDHSGIDNRQVTIKNYEGGHMMYLHDPSRERLSADIVAFMEATLGS
ncbi:MAG: S10 family peptidase [Planctomycetota bacterium]